MDSRISISLNQIKTANEVIPINSIENVNIFSPNETDFRNWGFKFIILGIGIFFLSFLIADMLVFLLSIILSIIGASMIYFHWRLWATYSLEIQTSSKTFKILRTRDREYLKKILSVIKYTRKKAEAQT